MKESEYRRVRASAEIRISTSSILRYSQIEELKADSAGIGDQSHWSSFKPAGYCRLNAKTLTMRLHRFSRVKKGPEFHWWLLLILPFSILACTGGPFLSEEEEGLWTQLGDTLVTKTFDTLRNTLLEHINKDGLAASIVFCREKAGSLTQAYSEDRVVIRRTSDRFRNPANRPDNAEYKVLLAYRQAMEESKPMNARVDIDSSGIVHYYKPIIVQPLCLNCHGDPQKQIPKDAMEAIRQSYPQDAATGYKTGDLRGIWHIRFRPS